MKKRIPIISKEEQEIIVSTVKKAESTTSGEIVPMIVPQSSFYPAATFLSGLIYALFFSSLITFFLMLGQVTGNAILDFFNAYFYEQLASFIIFFVLFLFFTPIFLILLQRLPFLKKIFLSRKEIEEQVQETAFTAFKMHGLDKTKRRNGLLIFVSLFEKRVTLIADCGISSLVPQLEWKKITDECAREIKKGNLAQGICEAVQSCGEILAKHFPKERRDTDELKNIIVEN